VNNDLTYSVGFLSKSSMSRAGHSSFAMAG
jgi:hypothetical protein